MLPLWITPSIYILSHLSPCRYNLATQNSVTSLNALCVWLPLWVTFSAISSNTVLFSLATLPAARQTHLTHNSLHKSELFHSGLAYLSSFVTWYFEDAYYLAWWMSAYLSFSCILLWTVWKTVWLLLSLYLNPCWILDISRRSLRGCL